MVLSSSEKKMRQLTILVFILLMVGNGAICASLTPKYGKEFNEERMKIGIPIIPDNWELNSVLQDSARWVNPERIEKHNERIPVHHSKGLNYRTGILLSETDIYYGKEDYKTIDGTFRENLSISYFYQVDDYSYVKRTGWWIILNNQQTEDASMDTEITIEEAEKILEEWGIERLSD